jgi:dephospho-CoA kinase
MKTSKPLLVGITGGIGSGKSTACRIFSILGVPIYYADDRAKWLMSHDTDLKQAIISNFGEESYTADGSLNRAYLASVVFPDEQKVAIINGLVHPAVKKDFEKWVGSQTAPYVLKEAALLFESGSYQDLDKIINVSAPLKTRITRVMMRDRHRTEKQIHEIIDKQLSDEEKNPKSDFVIKNADNKLLIPQVLELHRKLLAAASA